jgi:hypothetical protein
MPIRQRTVESRLLTACGSDQRPDNHQHIRYSGINRYNHPFKRSNLNRESVENPKPGEPTPSFKEQKALPSSELSAEAMADDRMPAEATMHSMPPVTEIPPQVANRPQVTAPLAEDNLPNPTESVYLQEMINEVQSDFSSQAGSLLDALGMGHMKRGNSGKAEDGTYKFSGKELVLAMEKLVREHKSKV